MEDELNITGLSGEEAGIALTHLYRTLTEFGVELPPLEEWLEEVVNTAESEDDAETDERE